MVLFALATSLPYKENYTEHDPPAWLPTGTEVGAGVASAHQKAYFSVEPKAPSIKERGSLTTDKLVLLSVLYNCTLSLTAQHRVVMLGDRHRKQTVCPAVAHIFL